jgi:outer membrane PBP1 activator LpoA protein
MNSKNWLIIAIVLSLLGCAQTPNRDVVLENGTGSPAALLIEETKLAINAGEFRNADLLLQQLNATPRTPAENLQFNLLALEFAITQKDVEQAKLFLDSVDEEQLNKSTTDILIHHGLLRAEFHELSGHFLTAAQERDLLSGLLEAETKDKNHQKIWQDLTNVSIDGLIQRSETANNPQFQSWLELAIIAKNPIYTLEEHILAVKVWRTNNPSHPAGIQLPGGLSQLEKIAQEQPKHIALLLPLSGNLSSSGEAIREGFMAAYYQTLQRGYDVPIISIIDTEAAGGLELAYDDALALGAEWVIGPLEKHYVNQLASLEALPLPTLALNYSDNASLAEQPDNLYQFGLSAEDEAILIAEKAFQLGYRRTLALTPDSDWGKRIYSAFEQHWLSLGGEIAKQIFYSSKKDYNPDIKTLLNVDDSVDRYKEIRRLMREPVEFEPRRRQDADWVFLLALPTQGRQIKPMFDFNFASDLPIFSTSHIYGGQENRKKDVDLNGIQFTDLPWLLESSELKKDVENNQSRAVGSYSRLYAMGVDAFRLYPRLQQLSALPYSRIFGVTGDLSIDFEGKVHRKMPFAVFKYGRPVAVDSKIK